MVKRIGTMDVYKLLPQTNCGECGEPACMAFAAKLVERSVKIKDCPPLIKEKKYAAKLEQLTALLTPPVREVVVGVREKAVKVGGEVVLYRHDLTFFNKTVMAVDLHDFIPQDQLVKRVSEIENFRVTRLAKAIPLDMIALRAVSNDPDHFKEVVGLVGKNTTLPLILCSYNPDVLKAALEVVGPQRPLLYAATRENWREVGELALKYQCPVVVMASDSLDSLKSIAHSLREMGVVEMILDPGTNPGEGLQQTFSTYTLLRRAAIEKEDPDLAYPLLATPAVVWMKPEETPAATIFQEAILGGILTVKYADLAIFHTLETWDLLPLLTLRENVYTDPRRPVAVTAGLREFGNPTPDSPVLMTANFSLTFYTVEADIQGGGFSGYVLVIDTEGMGVEVGVAGRQLTAGKVAELIKSSGIEGKVKHRKLIIPGMAARLKGDLEDSTGWEILVGPRDSGDVPKYLNQYWGKETPA